MTKLEDKRKAKAATAPAAGQRPTSIRFRSATVSTIHPQAAPKPKAEANDSYCPCGGRPDRRGKVQRCTRIADVKYHADGCAIGAAIGSRDSRPYNPPGSAARTEKKVAPRPVTRITAGGKRVFILLYEDMAERILAGTVTESDKTDIQTRLEVARAKKGQKAS